MLSVGIMCFVDCGELCSSFLLSFQTFSPYHLLRVKLDQVIQLILVSQLVLQPGMGSQGYVTDQLHCNCLGTKVPGIKHELTSLGHPGLAISQELMECCNSLVKGLLVISIPMIGLSLLTI